MLLRILCYYLMTDRSNYQKTKFPSSSFPPGFQDYWVHLLSFRSWNGRHLLATSLQVFDPALLAPPATEILETSEAMTVILTTEYSFRDRRGLRCVFCRICRSSNLDYRKFLSWLKLILVHYDIMIHSAGVTLKNTGQDVLIFCFDLDSI